MLVTVLLFLLFGGGVYVSMVVLLDRDLPLIPGPAAVAVVPVDGLIASEQRILDWIERYRDRESVRGFVLEIRSPGGTVGASQSLFREIRKLREEDGRPVVAWIGDMGASGGYYVALAADSIYALPGSITGSVGVVMQFPNAESLLRRAGVEVEIVRSGEHKDAGSLHRPLTEADREVFQDLVDDVYRQFLNTVEEERSLEPATVEALADGRVFSGERARELGLVDDLVTLSEAVDRAGVMSGLGERPRTVRPREPPVGLREVLAEAGTVLAERILGWPATDISSPRLLYYWR